MNDLIGAGIIAASVLASSFIINRKMTRIGNELLFAIIKGSFIANFSRYGQLDGTSIAVIDDKHAYFIRDSALWVADFANEDLVMQSARPIDLVNADVDMLKEAMFAVDILNDNVEDDDDEEEE